MFFQFVKKYGNLTSLDFGNIPSVIITGLPLIKEVFTNMEQNFLNRPITPIRKRVFNNNGKFNWQHYWLQWVI
jgi:cytochrome P450 family 2 subfamily J